MYAAATNVVPRSLEINSGLHSKFSRENVSRVLPLEPQFTLYRMVIRTSNVRGNRIPSRNARSHFAGTAQRSTVSTTKPLWSPSYCVRPTDRRVEHRLFIFNRIDRIAFNVRNEWRLILKKETRLQKIHNFLIRLFLKLENPFTEIKTSDRFDVSKQLSLNWQKFFAYNHRNTPCT